MNVDKIGQFIFSLRTEKGFSQEKLAKMIPVTRQAVSSWEKGRTVPDSSTLVLLGQIFGVSVNELLLGERIKEDNMQEVTLDLYDKYNYSKKVLRDVMIVSAISLTLLAALFFGYYFLSSYNTINVYNVSAEGKYSYIKDGIFITTKQKSYLRLGTIKSLEDKEILRVKLYFYNNKHKQKLIYDGNSSDILITESYGYNNYFSYNDLKFILNNLKVEIIYGENDSDILNVGFKKDFSNSLFFYNRKSSVFSDKIIDYFDSSSNKITNPTLMSPEIVEEVEEKQEIIVDENKTDEKEDANKSSNDTEQPTENDAKVASSSDEEIKIIDTANLHHEVENAIKSKGTYDGSYYVLEKTNGNETIKLSLFNNEFSLEVKNEDVREIFFYYTDKGDVMTYSKKIGSSESDYKMLFLKNAQPLNDSEKKTYDRFLSYVEKYLF